MAQTNSSRQRLTDGSRENGGDRVDFALFAHWDSAREESQMTRLLDGKTELERLLEPESGPQGVLFLWVDIGWVHTIEGVVETQDERDDIRMVSHEIPRALGNLSRRLRLITAPDLRSLLNYLRTRVGEQVFRWFVGEEGRPKYDSPKVVEAFIRIRALGGGTPLFRLDHDVLLPPESPGSTGVTNSDVNLMLEHYSKRRLDPRSRNWVFSAGYEQNLATAAGTFEDWSRAFATRVQPALVATEDLCGLIRGHAWDLLSPGGDLIPSNSSVDAQSIIETAFVDSRDAGLVHAYYGLDQQSADLRLSSPPCGIARVGADPLHSVISGALLHLSTGAIYDLPPFSNFANAVMWVDDHLKYELHRAMGHFYGTEELPGRVEDLPVKKGRSLIGQNAAAYIWCSYLPTLTLGIVMDYWIRGDEGDAGSGELAELLSWALGRQGKRGPHSGLTAREALKRQSDLRAAAVRRLRVLHCEWTSLNANGRETMACVWARGGVDEAIEKCGAIATDRLNGESTGMGLFENSVDTPVSSGDLEFHHLRKPMQRAIQDLIVDAIDYVHLALEWPDIIQTVRNHKKPGELKVDLQITPY